MSGRRARATVPQPRPRSRNNSRNVAFDDDVPEIPTSSTVRKNNRRADIYVPPQMQNGLSGRDGAAEYNPYSPDPSGNSVRYWPQPNSNHRPAVTNQDASSLNSTVDSTYRNVNAIVDAKRKIRQIGAEIDRTSNGLRYSESSEEERYNPEYREMDEDDASYLQSQSTMGSCSLENGSGNASLEENGEYNQRSYRKDEQFRLGFITKSISESATFETTPFDGIGDTNSDGGESFFKSNQTPAFCTIAITSVQLLLLMLQLTMCGVASLDINPTIGPFPDAYSQWGGKNPYLLLNENQWWRLLTPAFLHVGVAHLVVNIYCQISAAAMFERDWGWFKWLFIYIASEIGCSVFSNLFDPDTVAVGSTGALMGLFAAKLSQVVIFGLFETKSEFGDAIALDQLSTILCGLTLASLMGALTYIDFSGNLGGLVSGFFAGIYVFSSCINGCCTRFWWMLIGLVGLTASFAVPLYYFLQTEPEEQLSDVCEYFRSFFPEGYECGCLWS
jgi:membrane associated rhomboid family serine protease